MSKTTSLATLTEALTQHGWAFEATEAEVAVPDYDSPDVIHSRYSGRARWVPTKKIPGVVVTANNRQTDVTAFEQKSFSTAFTADGKYLALHTTGSYPFNQKGYSLKNILSQVEKYAPQVLADRKVQRAAEEAEAEASEVREVLAAHTAAKEALTDAQFEAHNVMTEEVGLTGAQAEAMLVMVQTGQFGPLLSALTQVQRTSEGWLPGKSYVRGTYKDGLPVS